jgi:prepilin signal peptidase PulO-like enzyme (type II secretory pathway)
MEYFFYICLFVFGIMFWSFWSVIIYRLKSWEWWITNWRSHCPKCDTMLDALDLIPVVSWVANKAKCRYCKTKVSSIYPLLELITWSLFVLIWYFLIDYNLIINFNLVETTKLLFWLVIWFITILYAFYDILFLEIHEWILVTWVSIMLIALWAQTLFPEFLLIETLPIWIENPTIWLAAIFITLDIIWILYIIMLKELHEVVDIILIFVSIYILYLFKTQSGMDLSDIAILNWLIWVLSIFLFFFIQIIISRWAWMWWWDLRIAIMIWLMLWTSYSFPGLMITYLVWSAVWIAFIAYSKIKNKWWKLDTQIPFWPFLAIWFFMTIFYSTDISYIMSKYF